MSYSTAAALLGTLSADLSTQLSTEGGNVPDHTIVDKAIDAASKWMDGYLGRYAPPIVLGTNGTQLTLDVLDVHCQIIAKHGLFGRKTAGDAFKQPDEDFQASRKYLEGIQAGAALPGAMEAQVDTQSVAVSGSSIPGEVVFTDDSAVL